MLSGEQASNVPVVDRPYRIGDLSIGGILDHTLYLIRDRFGFILLAILIFQVPFNLLTFGVAVWMGLEAIDPMVPNPGEMFTLYGAYGISGALNTLVVMPLMTGTIIHGIATHYTGSPSTIRQSLRHAVSRWVYFAIAHILFTIGVVLGMFMCIIPGFFLQFYWILFQPIVVLEDAGPVKALIRSGELIWGMMAIALVLYLCVSLFYLPLTMIAVIFPGAFAQFVASHLASGFAGAANAVMITVLYCSARARKEHLDLDLMADRIAPAVSAEPAL